MPSRFAKHALLHPTFLPEESAGPAMAAGPAQKHDINSHANPGRHCMLTVRVEVDRAVRDVAALVVRNAHGQVEAVHKGDIVVVEAVATRDT